MLRMNATPADRGRTVLLGDVEAERELAGGAELDDQPEIYDIDRADQEAPPVLAERAPAMMRKTAKMTMPSRTAAPSRTPSVAKGWSGAVAAPGGGGPLVGGMIADPLFAVPVPDGVHGCLRRSGQGLTHVESSRRGGVFRRSGTSGGVASDDFSR